MAREAISEFFYFIHFIAILFIACCLNKDLISCMTTCVKKKPSGDPILGLNKVEWSKLLECSSSNLTL